MKKKTTKIYNHMFDVAFSIVTTVKDPYKVAPQDLIEALEARVRYLKGNISECAEAFGYSDSYVAKKS